jgi:hypothetical protein
MGNQFNRKHEMSNTSEYEAYCHAKRRCRVPKDKAFADYGGRGIKFLFTSFVEFINHIGLKPSPELALDRIDNDGHYEVGNVRWLMPGPSVINTRKRKDNTSGYRGVTKCRSKWMAQISTKGQHTYIGVFLTAKVAAQAYDTAAIQHHGKHARLNFPKISCGK